MLDLIARFFTKPKWPDFTPDQIRQRARIVVIDDEQFPYLGLFHKDGYNVDKWDDVEDLPKLEAGYYDLILLDIQGVGKAHSEDQGAGILRHLRQTSPAQLIIAYSNADWSMKYQDFFQVADARLDKRSDYVDFKRVVDKLLEQRFSIGFYVEKIVAASGHHVPDIEQLRRVARAALATGSTKKLEKFLLKQTDDAQVLHTLLAIVRTGLKVGTLYALA